VPQAGRAIRYNQKKPAKPRTITVDSTEGRALAGDPRTRAALAPAAVVAFLIHCPGAEAEVGAGATFYFRQGFRIGNLTLPSWQTHILF